MDALLRRLESVKRDGLRIDARPGGGQSARPLRDEAEEDRTSGPIPRCWTAVEPIEASCDCPDFLKNSLGVCKHILTVLEHLYSRPRLLQQALKEQEASGVPPRPGCAGTRSGP